MYDTKTQEQLDYIRSMVNKGKTIKILPLTEERFIPPRKGSCQAAAFDVYTQTDLVLNDETKTIKLGFAAEIPDGYAAVLIPRSGFGNKLGMRLMGTVGLIDSDYRGEWMATIQLAKGKELQLSRGERFLQFYLMEAPKFDMEIVSELTETKRGTGGYGSTGTE